jgi:hypothetical protein
MPNLWAMLNCDYAGDDLMDLKRNSVVCVVRVTMARTVWCGVASRLDDQPILIQIGLMAQIETFLTYIEASIH